MEHGAWGPRALSEDVFQAQLSSAISGPDGTRVIHVKEVKGNSEFILMSRDKESFCTQAAAGF